MLDFRIATFLKLCETRSYTKTAKMLNITQPSVTQHIKYLQRKYQCRLFRYEEKMLNLTPEGEYLFAQADAMTRMSAKVIADLQRMSASRKALRFGCPSEIGETVVTRIVAELLKTGAARQLDITVRDMAELTDMLENGQLDVILTDRQYQPGQFLSVPVAEVHYACYAAPALATAYQGHGLADLKQESLIMRNAGAMDRAVLERCLEQHHVLLHEFHDVMTANTAVSAQELAVSGIGVLFTYASGVRDAVAQNRLQELKLSDFPLTRSLVFCCEAGKEEEFREFFAQFRESWNHFI